MLATERVAGWLRPSLADAPLNEALAAGLRGLILDGRLVSGSRLPAERELAAALGLARATVTAAYDRLRGEGYLLSRRGAGTLVHLPVRPIARPDDAAGPPDRSLIDLTVAALPAPPSLPEAVAAVAGMAEHLGAAGLHPMGVPELRKAVADRYTARGLPTSPDEILVTSGALHAWNLLLRALTRPGAAVVAEQPTYPAVLDAALAHHLRVHPLPVGPEGWDLAQLGRPARPPVLAHLALDGQNPTGLWADEATRRRLLAGLHPATVIAVDETLAELWYDAPVARPAPAFAPRGRTVVTLGSMSKSFWAGLRVGWVRAPVDLVRRLAAVRAGQDLATAVLDQLVAVRLLAEADRVLPDRRALLAARRDVLFGALAEHAPGWRAARPQGGMAAWVELGDTSSTRLAQRALLAGVRVTPGPRFTLTGTHDRWVRLPFTQPPDRLVEAVRLLAAAATAAPALPRRAAAPRQRGGADVAWTA